MPERDDVEVGSGDDRGKVFVCDGQPRLVTTGLFALAQIVAGNVVREQKLVDLDVDVADEAAFHASPFRPCGAAARHRRLSATVRRGPLPFKSDLAR
jgi:hypothetical protein